MKFIYRTYPNLHVCQIINDYYIQDILVDNELVIDGKIMYVGKRFMQEIKQSYKFISDKQYDLLKLKIL